MRPSVVKVGVLLLWISLVDGILYDAYVSYSKPPGDWPMLIGVASMIATLSISALLVYKIGQQRNWARTTYLILAIVSYLGYFSTAAWAGLQEANVIELLLTIGTTITDIAALVLLFTPSANRWFRQR